MFFVSLYTYFTPLALLFSSCCLNLVPCGLLIKEKSHLHDLISCAESLLLSRAVLLNASDEDAYVIAPCQPHAHAVPFLEPHHHGVRPAQWEKRLLTRIHDRNHLICNRELRGLWTELIPQCGSK